MKHRRKFKTPVSVTFLSFIVHNSQLFAGFFVFICYLTEKKSPRAHYKEVAAIRGPPHFPSQKFPIN